VEILLPEGLAVITGAFLISINQNGLIQWYKRYFNYFTEECRSITNTNDGGFALTGWYDSAGYSYQRLIIIKTDSLGNEQWRRIKNSNDYYKGNSIIQTSDNGDVTAGYKNNDMYILKTDELGFNTIGIKQISSEIPYTSKLYQNYPNPFNPSTKIRFSFPLIEGARGRNVHLIIYDLLGREVFTLVNEQLQPGTYEVDWDGTNYASGLYLYRLETGTFVETKKMLLIK
jgi:hypothetical protein